MPELGAVVGAVLADLVRARMVVDKMTAGIVKEYEDDPILSSMTVPRAVIGETTVTVRYIVDDISAPEKVAPDPEKFRTELRRLGTSLSAELRRGPTAVDQELEDAIAKIATSAKAPPVAQIRKALAGDASDAVSTITERVVGTFAELPPGIRRKLGPKAAFTKMVERTIEAEVKDAVLKTIHFADLKAVFDSKVNVSVSRADLQDDPTQIQTITLTVRPDDLDIIGLDQS